MIGKAERVAAVGTAALLFILLATSQPAASAKLNQERQQQQAASKQQLESITGDSATPGARLNVIQGEEGPQALYMLGLFDLHQKSSTRAPFKCGPLELDAGEQSARRPMQNLMAFLWAIEQVNQDSSLLPGIKLGSIVMDTCSSFLRTNQRLANLLHEGVQRANGESPLVRPSRQLAAIVADQHDWQSVEATASMASALGVATFVSQSRSTKLSELARRYADGGQLAADQPEGSTDSAERQLDERLLGELLGIGRLMTPPPPPDSTDQVLAELRGQLAELSHQAQAQQSARLLMVRMLLNNEIVADALASLCDQMKWDLLSLVYEADEADMLDLHDELARQLFLRNTQLALDEPLAVRNERRAEELLTRLAQKAQFGARVVISLVNAEGARLLQATLGELRRKLAANKESASRLLLKQLNSLIWITTADREPFYAHATDSLGMISVAAGSSSLMADFKAFYDQHAHSSGLANPWWPEYVRSILAHHQKLAEPGNSLELLTKECSKWVEPSRSPIRQKCGSLSLSSLLELERSNKTSINKSGSTATWKRPDQTRSKLAKYLAGGWEHNGMSVINSVLAAANALESLRQKLCPGLASGMCQQMRDLIAPPSSPDSQEDPSSSSSIRFEPPTLSELLHAELARSTFQLADGQMFSLDDGSQAGPFASQPGAGAASPNQLEAGSQAQQQAPASQLDAKVKFYNLRFLRPNLIGFVKFAHFDQQNGLKLVNQSEALHYGALPADLSDHTPLAQLQSTCLDASKCLMLAAWLGTSSGGANLTEAKGTNRAAKPAAISEEELAEGVNSLFKLDHPLISGGQKVVSSQQLKSLLGAAPAKTGEQDDADKFLRTMRPRPQMVAWPASAFEDAEHDGHNNTDDKQQHPQQADNKASSSGARQFQVIVLLPLHKAEPAHQQLEYSAAKSTTTTTSGKCSANIDQAHAFQQLAALAYAQTLVNGRRRSLTSDRSTGASNDNTMKSSTSTNTTDDKPTHEELLKRLPVELTISVIDYCAQIDLIERRMLDKLTASADELVAIIDFDWRVGKQVGRVLDEWRQRGNTFANKPLHLTIARPTSREHESDKASLQSASKGALETLRLNLLPSKAQEIEALAHMLSSLPNSRLVHLIYADRHEYRDEFIRRANELGICVSKLIFVPEAVNSNELAWNLSAAELQEQFQTQLKFTRRLFEGELSDYSRPDAVAPPGLYDDSVALNSTRVLVVLASSSEQTNQLILQAATDSMLNDYVWLTTHEWLNSVELPAEQAAARNPEAQQSTRLPRLFLSTKMETFQGHNFRHFLSGLTPVVHAPLPTDWFDEFWQQHFHCRLPIPGILARAANQSATPLCGPLQRLEPSEIIEDDRIHFTIRAIEALHVALEAQPFGVRQGEALAQDFRLAFDGQPIARGSWARERQRAENRARQTDVASDLLRPLVGFHLVHRLIANKSVSARRANSRQLVSPNESRLVRVGVWRKLPPSSRANSSLSGASSPLQLAIKPGAAQLGATGEKVSKFQASFADRPTVNKIRADRDPLLPVDQAFSMAPAVSEADNDDLEFRQISDSLGQLATINSRCSSEESCALCRQQITQMQTLIRQEEAKLSLARGENLPRVVSSIGVNNMGKQQRSVESAHGALDKPSRLDSNFYDNEAEVGENAGELASRIDLADKKSPTRASHKMPVASFDDIQAAASSLFDQRASEQVASEMRRVYGHQMSHRLRQPAHSVGSRASQQTGALMSILSLVGIALTVASMTHFYPKMREHHATRLLANKHGSFRSTASSTCNIIGADNECDELGSARKRPSSGSFLGAIMDNINDYLILIGLLMLYTINIAFLLPATLSVCTFRRIGLPFSYTILFGAILARALHIWRQQARRPRISQLAGSLSKSTQSGGSLVPNRMRALSSPGQRQHDQLLESVHESVEVTFESLPHEEHDFGPSYQQEEQSVATISATGEHFWTSTRQQLHVQQHNSKLAAQEEEEPSSEQQVEPGLQLPLVLLISQFVASLVWLVRNPPEPTLLLGCWFCSSARLSSANIFLYEPVVTLGQPTLLLLAAWLGSIIVFKRSSQADERYQLAIRRFLNSQPLTFTVSNNPEYSRLKAHQLQVGQQLRESKSLLITNALLVLVWCLALTFVCSQRSIQESMSASSSSFRFPNRPVYTPLAHQAADDLGLVYMNLASGAIIFALLFVYRLRLFNRRSPFKRSHYSHIKSSSGPLCLFACCLPNSSASSIAPMRLFRNHRGSKTFAPAIDQTAAPYLVQKFNGSQENESPPSDVNPSGRERLKLQQFSSTYGTYSTTNCDAVEDRFQEPARVVDESQERPTKSKKSLFTKNKKNDKSQRKQCDKQPSKKPLQRRHSNSSVASAALKLVTGTGRGNQMESDDFEAASTDGFDMISCAMSVASNSTSQLQGNDLYPIDCSIQLADGATGSQAARDGQPAS